ncbi:MAG TPA: hypothetical protein VKO18_09335 [Terriglobia bacterium]|nr:hypothetical protein [Terriglobia bacterium]
MFIATLILILVTGLFFFYFQATCRMIMRRQFPHSFWQAIADANRLEFPAVRKALEELGVPVEYPPLTDLVKNAANVNRRYTYEEFLLVLYFRWVYASLVACHWLRLRETPAALELTAILQYFANVVGARANTLCF